MLVILAALAGLRGPVAGATVGLIAACGIQPYTNDVASASASPRTGCVDLGAAGMFCPTPPPGYVNTLASPVPTPTPAPAQSLTQLLAALGSAPPGYQFVIVAGQIVQQAIPTTATAPSQGGISVVPGTTSAIPPKPTQIVPGYDWYWNGVNWIIVQVGTTTTPCLGCTPAPGYQPAIVVVTPAPVVTAAPTGTVAPVGTAGQLTIDRILQVGTTSTYRLRFTIATPARAIVVGQSQLLDIDPQRSTPWLGTNRRGYNPVGGQAFACSWSSLVNPISFDCDVAQGATTTGILFDDAGSSFVQQTNTANQLITGWSVLLNGVVTAAATPYVRIENDPTPGAQSGTLRLRFLQNWN